MSSTAPPVSPSERDSSFLIEDMDVLAGIGGFWCNDQPAIQAGATPDGFFFQGGPVTPGFQAIREPSTAFLCVARLEDGFEVQGDCTTVANAGYSGRPPPLRADDVAVVRDALVRVLAGRRFSGFLDSLRALDGLDLPARLLPPVAFGASELLLAAAAFSRRTSMAAVLRRELGREGDVVRVPGLAGSCGNEGQQNIDKAIARHVAMFPQSAIQTRGECERLPELVSWIAQRIGEIGGPDYRPDLHFDFHSVLGRMFDEDEDRVFDYLAEVVGRAGGLAVYFEDPVLARGPAEAAERMARLRERIRAAGLASGLIADQWANEGEQIRLFLDAGAADAIQIKLPDNGSILNAVRSVEACQAAGVLAYLGGSCNETDVSTRVTAHLAVALDVWRVFTKPGLGFDEGLMILTNEMKRAAHSLR